MNKKFLAAAALALAVSIAAGCASLRAQGAPAEYDGGVLVDYSKKMTLYTFDKDPGDGSKSVCNGPCAANWPPLTAAPDAKPAGDYTIITRDDGGKQWAFKGKPLYTWVKDQKPGDKTGDGVNKVWRVAKP
jgi:predicted lipoprotein with Yx(FWY)xxD motif